jgi:transcriptional regulator with XRE-family HTH domain
LGLKQEGLANAAGMSKGFLSEVETGNRNPSAEYLLRIANALGVSLDFLMKGQEDVSTDSGPRAIQVPASLAAFAHEKHLPFPQVRAVLEAKLQLVANRRDSGQNDLEDFDWSGFYDAIKDYL